MQITCPSCFSRFPIDVAINDRDTRIAVGKSLLLPGELGPLVLRYLPVFNPKQRSLSWKRTASLLAELNEAVTGGCVRRNGRDWRVTTAMWEQALTVVLERRDSGKLDLPFKDHAYLYTIVVDLADKAEGAQEQQREQQQRDGNREVRGGGFNAAEALVNSAEYQRKVAEQLGLNDTS